MATKGLPGLSDTLALARATSVGDLNALFQLNVPSNDITGPAGYSASVGPSPVELAIVELAVDTSGEVRGNTHLTPGVITRLESRGTRVPWPKHSEAQPFGKGEPPAAPDFTLKTPAGGELALAQHDGPIILSFWATWCGPCRQELPLLDALRSELGPQGLQVWAISLEDSPEEAARWMKEKGLSLPIAMGDAEIRRSYSIGPIPRTVVIGPDKTILRDHTGFSPEHFARLSDDVRLLVGGTLSTSQVLGYLEWGSMTYELLATDSSSTVPPRAMVTDKKGGLWVANEKRLAPVALINGDLVTDESRAVPLAFPANRLAWGDVDGDGTEELLAATAGGDVLRLSKRDGEAIWTSRHPDPITDAVFMKGGDGGMQVAAMRVGLNPLSEATDARPAVAVPSARVDLISKGQLLSSVSLAGDGVGLISSKDGRVLALPKEGAPLLLSGSQTPQAVDLSVQHVRNAQWTPWPTQNAQELLIASGAAAQVLALERADGGTHVAALTGGGTLVGLNANGTPDFRLRLQKRSQAIAADLDGDGSTELILSVPGFGLAVLGPKKLPNKPIDPQ